jgi:hypothetical protein
MLQVAFARGRRIIHCNTIIATLSQHRRKPDCPAKDPILEAEGHFCDDEWSLMNLIAFSIRTKGVRNFARRLWTVFARFGITEGQTRRALRAIMESLCPYRTAPTFFIPAVVLRRHSALLAEVAGHGAEIGIHGYVHNDYCTLSESEQYK